ncbi:hypothetical protein EOD41_17090 [Mucilaginibacter limnophilus]|uniref:Uncharacterized protein n=1 Tax=Mucilaginibacter limnophilus TaxID=1932778 RepID=A0A3S2XZ85_9SPHI|nr:hypothetical protein [Mucilaginibacter limnophilus]RVT98502.1 hypothetical protein EOD41_17090 [Mucilaginibacter limnophilus]
MSRCSKVQLFMDFIMSDYKSKLSTLADKLKGAPPATPIQEVHPVKATPVETEPSSRFNNWIPKSLKKRLKAYAAENDISLKDINIQALQEYLDKRIKVNKE